MDDTERHDTIAKVTDLIAARYPGVPRAVIGRVVTEEYDALDPTRIRTFILIAFTGLLVLAGTTSRLLARIGHTTLRSSCYSRRSSSRSSGHCTTRLTTRPAASRSTVASAMPLPFIKHPGPRHQDLGDTP
jgi:hypothetical protein